MSRRPLAASALIAALAGPGCSKPAAPPASAAAVPSPEAPAPPDEAPGFHAIAIARRSAPPDSPLVEYDGPKLVVGGSLVVADEQGTELTRESGTFELVSRARGASYRSRATVQNGQWRGEVVPFAPFAVQCVRVGGREAVPVDDASRLFAGGGDDLALHVRWSSPGRLHVEDASGRELDGVDVVWTPPDGAIYPDAVEEDAVLARRAASPIDVRSALDEARLRPRSIALFARAPGCAWNRIDCDWVYGGERELRLEPGGDVRIALPRRARVPETTLFLRRGDRSSQPWAARRTEHESEIAFESLPCGRYLATLERWNPRPSSIDDSTVRGEAEAKAIPLEFQSRRGTLEVLDSLEIEVIAGKVVQFEVPASQN
jgi:hypothetical protein